MFDLKKAAEAQKRLSVKLRLEWDGRDVNLLAGADCSYHREKREIGAIIVVCRVPDFEIVEIVEAIRDVKIPYIPGFLNYREGPAFLKAFQRIRNIPDVILVDGNGIAHPRRMGLASYLGILLNICTVGCAKKPFFPFVSPGEKRGAYSLFKNHNNEQVGFCLRTRSGIKPIFVSPGHKIDFNASKKLVLDCSRYRIPEPLRHAHRLASQIFK